MEKFDFNIGAAVHCKNTKCGKLQRVVVDPKNMEVTDLIVERGLFKKENRIVPVSKVEQTSDDYVMLSISDIALEDYPEYQEFRVDASQKNSEEQDVDSAFITPRVSSYGIDFVGSYIPVLYYKKVKKNLKPDQEVITRGTSVHTFKSKIGHVDHMLVDSKTGDLSHIVIDPGLLDDSYILPISKVEHLEGEGIVINIDENELDQFPEYSPRPDDEIAADLRAQLQSESFLEDIQVIVENGILIMNGMVPDVAAKRRMEYIARTMDGVVDVENYLQPENVTDSQILAALSDDPRTKYAVIDVIEDRSVVTLRGQVDNVEILQAAVEIAEAQPGVVKVINGLSVKEDQFSPAFVTRYTKSQLMT